MPAPRPTPARPRRPEAAMEEVARIAADLPDAPRVLVTGPPGSGKSRLALAAFDLALERHGAEGALLVLPTYGEAEHHKRLAISRREERRDARGILDVSYATFTSLGERLSPGFRVRALPSRRERDLLAGAALDRADVEAFREVRDRPGFRARFLRLVKEMKQSGEDPALLRRRAQEAAAGLASRAARERLEGFLRAWETYDGLLERAGCPDHEDVLRDLVGSLRGPAPALSRVALLVVDGFEDLTGVEAALLDAAADRVVAAGGRVLVTLPWDEARPALFETTKPLRDRLARRGYVVLHREGFARSRAPGLARLATELFRERAPGETPPPALDPRPDVQSLVGSDDADEIDRIGREILRLRREEPAVVGGFRDVGIVFRRLDGVGPAARRALEALGIPARLVGSGARLSAEAVVRALRGPLRLLGGEDGTDGRDFDPMRLLDYLRWRALASGATVPIEAVDAADLRWRGEVMPVDWAAARRSLEREGPAVRALVDDLDAWRARAATARGAASVWGLLEEAIVAWLPLPASAGLAPDGRPVDPEGDERLRRAVAARERFADLAREAARAAVRTGVGTDVSVADAVEDLLLAADEATSEPADRRLDAVHLLDAEEARHWELPVVFVGGLVEKGFPLHPREDVFLRDADREALRGRLGGDGGPAWRTARDAEEGERRLFLSAVTRARRRLYLTRAAADEDGREQAPSFFWRDVARALGRAPEEPALLGRAPDDLGRLHPPPREAVVERDLLRFAAERLGALALPGEKEEADRALAVALLRAGGAAAAGVVRRAARFLRPDPDPLLPARLGALVEATATLSPTAINAGRACLHRFFLSYVARVPSDEVPFRGRPFDRRLYGELVHLVLRRAMEAPQESAQALAAGVVTEKADRLADPASRAWAQEDLERVVTLMRDRERLLAGLGFVTLPRDVEVRFGENGREVTLGSGDTRFRLRGQIDRLDTSEGSGPRLAVVVDYKTGVAGTKDAAKRLRALEDLQLPLYAKAVEGPRGVRVVALEHATAGRRGRQVVGDDVHAAVWEARAEGEKPLIVPASDLRGLLEGAERAAEAVVGEIRRGSHAKRPLDLARCEECPVIGVCRPDTTRFPARREEDDS